MTTPQRKMLIVEDNPADRALFRLYLQDIADVEWSIREEERGEAGLATCRTFQPDCILLDYQLPDLDGLAFLERLRREYGLENCAVVLATGLGDEAVAVEAMKRGAQDYLVKGKTTEEVLWRAIQNALEKVELARTVAAQRSALEDKNRELQQTLAALRQARDELELRVQERTAELLQATEALRQSEYQLLVITDNIPALIGYVGRDLHYRFANRQHAAWFGIPQEQILGQHLRDLLGDAVFQCIAVHITACLSGQELSFENHLQCARGITRSVLVHLVPDTRDGKVEGFFVLITDVSEQKRLEARLREQERLKTIGLTAVNLTHEIGNRLNGISTTMQILEHCIARQPAHADDLLAETVRDLKTETRRMQAVLKDLRTFTTAHILSLRPTNVAAVAAEVICGKSSQYQALGIRTEHAFPTGLPWVTADREKLSLVLLHLCTNAVEAMPRGGILTMSATASAGQVWIHVQDTGVGIPDGVNVFEPFHTTKAGGTGLGLAIVKQIVEAHGGRITYTSGPGHGTTFTLVLPAVGADASRSPTYL
ncbi:MAG TPA: ATP-binding protein [Candidatus Binatia bacterium]|jgi:PAS domain S-box-containing protein|nr:ATP-binding protein [Candidatus Binatia bacterium]